MDEAEQQSKQTKLAHCKNQAEKAYDAMYEAHSFRDANVCYSDAKEFLYDAIKLANELGSSDEATSLTRRLEQIKGVFRSQFVQ